MEKIERGGKKIWIDGGHNAHAIAAIAPFIAEQIAPPRLLVFGIMSDKDVDAVTGRLFPLFDRIITTEPYPPRSVPATSFQGATPIADPDEAFAAALDSPEAKAAFSAFLAKARA